MVVGLILPAVVISPVVSVIIESVTEFVAENFGILPKVPPPVIPLVGVADVILPLASTTIFGIKYVPAVTPELLRSIVILLPEA